LVTLGLLETDTLYDDLITDYGSYGQMFMAFFEGLGGNLRYRFYDVQLGELPTQMNECDAYLITGSKAAVYDQLAWIQQLQQWISDYYELGARFIGICFGHQIIAQSLGGHAAKNLQGWAVGVHETRLSELNNKDNSPTTLRLLHSHQDQVLELPPQAQLLASSDFCPQAAYKIANQVLSFQGHPEFTPQYLRRLLLRRKAAIGEEVYSQAMASLDESTDAEYVGKQLIAFIKNK
jgi:GMP synthase-like glutamine amidotransferase